MYKPIKSTILKLSNIKDKSPKHVRDSTIVENLRKKSDEANRKGWNITNKNESRLKILNEHKSEHIKKK